VAFRCLNPRLFIFELIAFRVLINPRLSMGSMEKLVFIGLGPNANEFYKIEVFNLKTYECSMHWFN
jgi:hypothetical protein